MWRTREKRLLDSSAGSGKRQVLQKQSNQRVKLDWVSEPPITRGGPISNFTDGLAWMRTLNSTNSEDCKNQIGGPKRR